MVSVGSGGGAAANWRTVRLQGDGTLVVEFATLGVPDAEVSAGRLGASVAREAWTLLQGDAFGRLGCEPGNMTDEVEFRAAGRTQRACAPMGSGSPEFRRIHDEIARLIAMPAAGVHAPPPPIPPLPALLILEVQRASGRVRVAREGSSLPTALAAGAQRVADALIEPPWHAVFESRFYSGASIEDRDGVLVPGAPFACGKDVSVRVTTGADGSWETRQRCVEGDAAITALADAITLAASR